MADRKNERNVKGTVGTITVGLVGEKETPVIFVQVHTDEGEKGVELYLSQGALPYTVMKCQAMGLPPERSLTWLDVNPNGLAGNPVNLFIYEEEYNGKWREKCDISTFKREVKKMAPEKLSAFDGLFAAAAKQSDLGF